MYNLNLENKIDEGMPPPPHLIGKNVKFSIGKCNANWCRMLYNLKASWLREFQIEAKIIARQARRLSTNKLQCCNAQLHDFMVNIYLKIKR